MSVLWHIENVESLWKDQGFPHCFSFPHVDSSSFSTLNFIFLFSMLKAANACGKFTKPKTIELQGFAYDFHTFHTPYYYY